jgi:RNA binding exosome subunit
VKLLKELEIKENSVINNKVKLQGFPGNHEKVRETVRKTSNEDEKLTTSLRKNFHGKFSYIWF